MLLDELGADSHHLWHCKKFMVMMFRMIVMLVVMLDVDKMRNGLGGDSKEVQMQRRRLLINSLHFMHGQDGDGGDPHHHLHH